MTWSPFHCFPKAKLTSSGLLQLDTEDHEVELLRRSCIELRHDGLEPMTPNPSHGTNSRWQDRTTDLSLIITTHRLVFFLKIGDSKNEARFLHLSNLHQINPTGGPSLQSWNASYKLVLSTYNCGELILVARSNNNPKNDRDQCQQQLEKALQRLAWETNTRLKEKQIANEHLTKRKVGVDHIIAKNKLKHKQAARLADDALSGDSEQLLKEAAELLQVIQKYVSMLQKQSKTTGEDDKGAQQLVSMLQDMGMASALTKLDLSSQSEYYEFLARQVADFMLPKLSDMGGVVTLTDVFCLFNRARGTNMISPEDLTKACEVLETLHLGISQKIFPSGIVVLQLDSRAMNQDQLLTLCPVTALEASHVLNVSPLLAQEQLEEAERVGLLCRDVTLETTRFYPNKFVSGVW